MYIEHLVYLHSLINFIFHLKNNNNSNSNNVTPNIHPDRGETEKLQAGLYNFVTRVGLG